jgi:hypothetical protein
MAFVWTDQIVREVGDPNTTVAAVIADLWTEYASLALIDAQLQVLYTKRAALNIRLAEEQAAIDVGLDGDTYRRGQRFDHLLAMRADTQSEIVRIEKRSTIQGVPVAGFLTKTAPLEPTIDAPDLNSPLYSGLPPGITKPDQP